MIIGFSGIDGSGKTTQLHKFSSWLSRFRVDVFCAKVKLYATSSIFSLSEKTFGDRYTYHPAIPATLREFVIACDVFRYYSDVIAPNLEKGRIVLWDRSPLCYISYAQAYGADLEWIRKLYDLIRSPDLIFLLDLPPEVAIERLKKRTEKPLQPDESFDLLSIARKRYLYLSTEFNNVIVIDADETIEKIFACILEVFNNYAASRNILRFNHPP